ncbi:hypothetical protein HanIR_Chr01g0022851 [Helianthus annuus]|nr:hypothetical protein HanIR_Chr01g0022851 [Helianthus annuus]
MRLGRPALFHTLVEIVRNGLLCFVEPLVLFLIPLPYKSLSYCEYATYNFIK